MESYQYQPKQDKKTQLTQKTPRHTFQTTLTHNHYVEHAHYAANIIVARNARCLLIISYPHVIFSCFSTCVFNCINTILFHHMPITAQKRKKEKGKGVSSTCHSTEKQTTQTHKHTNRHMHTHSQTQKTKHEKMRQTDRHIKGHCTDFIHTYTVQ